MERFLGLTHRLRPIPVLLLTALLFLQVKCTSTGTQTVDSVSAPHLDEQALARSIHTYVNRTRTERGLPSLRWNTALARIARDHSAAMASQNFFGHVNQQGQDPTARARQAGFECMKQEGDRVYTGVAENLYMTTQYSRWRDTVGPDGERTRTYDWKSIDQIARETVDGWMNSPGHRANLLNPIYDSQGIGVAVAADRDIFITENFC